MTNTINNNSNFKFTKGYTHAGVFHADEVFATAMLRKINPEFAVKRVVFTFDQDFDDETTLVYDIGLGKFDHHQKGGNGCRENGIPFASFGLLWKEFGNLVVENEEARNMIDRDLVSCIDAFDIGYVKIESNIDSIITVNQIISGFNPTWNSNENPDESFEKAVAFAAVILDNVIKNAVAKIEAKTIVNSAIIDAVKNNRKYAILSQMVPWQEWVLASENAKDILYVLYKTKRNDYAVQAVPDKPGSFGMRKALPESWRGQDVGKLKEITGISDIVFCHNTGFMATASSLDSAVKMACIAINS